MTLEDEAGRDEELQREKQANLFLNSLVNFAYLTSCICIPYNLWTAERPQGSRVSLRTKLVCVTGKMLPCQRQRVFGMQPNRSRADLLSVSSYVSLTAESFLGAGTIEE